MSLLRTNFEERLAEVRAHLELLEDMEAALLLGPLRLGASDKTVSPLQKRILYSAAYLQLYNLVEATVSWCAGEICNATSDGWKPADLSTNIREQWVRANSKLEGEVNEDTRIRATIKLCELLIAGNAVKMEIDTGGGGNWDDEAIFKFCRKLGVEVKISAATSAAVKRQVRDGKGALKLIVYLRNKLAHGSLSFSECGGDTTLVQLRELTDWTIAYLLEVIASFEAFIAGHHFLRPESRPPEAT